jgi:ribosome recycling factor
MEGIMENLNKGLNEIRREGKNIILTYSTLKDSREAIDNLYKKNRKFIDKIHSNGINEIDDINKNDNH